MHGKFTSRKFWMAVAAQVAALVVLFFPEHENEIAAAIQSVAALLVMVLAGNGYIRGEAQIDAERMRHQP